MDDQNNPIVPAQDQNQVSEPVLTPPPSASAQPLPVAPFTSTTTTIPTEPSAEVTTTTTTTPPATPVPGPTETPPQIITTTTATEEEVKTTTTTAPVPSEPKWPETKPKSQMPKILGGIAAIVLVIGAATAAYFVSQRISSRQAVAPTAPESEPLASGRTGTPRPTATPTPTTGGRTGTPRPSPTPSITPTATGRVTCSGSCLALSDCLAEGGSEIGGTCTRNRVCCELPSNDGGGSGGRGGGGGGGGGGGSSCTPDPAASKSITFSKTGTVHTVTRNFKGTITLAGPKTVTITGGNMGASEEIGTPFAVNAGETYTITFKWDAENNPGYGWIAPRSRNECSPSTTACGGTADILALMDYASSRYDLIGLTAGATPANVQCWGDMVQGDSTQDYDYNDGTVAFGYEKISAPTPTPTSPPPAVGTAGACTQVQIYKKRANGAYDTTPLTAAQLNQLKMGDKLRLAITGSKSNLKARFRVTINGIVENTGNTSSPEWRTAQGYAPSPAGNTVSWYSDYEVKSVGKYEFEAQVSTSPVTGAQ